MQAKESIDSLEHDLFGCSGSIKVYMIKSDVVQTTRLPEPVECSCEHCINACKAFPGIMSLLDIKDISSYFACSPVYFFRQHVAVMELTCGLVPISAAVGAPPGEIFVPKTGYRQQCHFLTSAGLCRIHSVKPLECRLSQPCKEPPGSSTLRKAMIQKWCMKDNQEIILGLLRGVWLG